MTRMTGSDCPVMCNLINTHTHAHLDSLKHGVDHVGAGLEDVGPYKVKEVHQSVLAAQHRHTERQMLHGYTRCL